MKLAAQFVLISVALFVCNPAAQALEKYYMMKYNNASVGVIVDNGVLFSCHKVKVKVPPNFKWQDLLTPDKNACGGAGVDDAEEDQQEKKQEENTINKMIDTYSRDHNK